MTLPHHPLSPAEVSNIVGSDINVFRYQDLDELSSIDELFKKTDCTLLLYETQINSGHWVCLINQPKQILFFDPYGLEPDNQLAYVNMKFRKENDMYLPHLSMLMYHSNKPIEYNDKRLQIMSPSINTCGYWCGFRMRLKDLSIKEFNDLFKGINRNEKDNAIIMLTEKYLQ